MEPKDFKGSNKTLTSPEGMEDSVIPLRVFTDGNTCVSCWKLSEEDLKRVNETGEIYLLVLSGETQPPVWIESKNPLYWNEEEVKDAVQD